MFIAQADKFYGKNNFLETVLKDSEEVVVEIFFVTTLYIFGKPVLV